MPAALDVDWEAIKILAREIGVRETARRMDIPEATLQARSAREGWIRDIPRSQPLPATMRQTATGATNGPKPSVVHAETLKELAGKTRLGHAKAQAKVAELVETMDAQEVLAMMPGVLQAVKASSILHGWTAGNNGAPSVRLDLIANSGGTALRLEMGGSVESESEEDEE